ncbi:MAG TPA: hypothetical protein VFV34_21000, partial [Blastocatellia bacterium]|nr:hypothetical protein [Blastocatellia bacterium]
MKQVPLSLLFALLISPAAAEACSCVGSATVCSAYANADGVFVGFVQRVETPANRPRERVGDLEVTQITYVQVERAFKGIDQPEVVFRSFNTSCDVTYKEGQRWLFYAGYDPKSKTWSIGYCSRSRLVDAAVDDLRYLEALPVSGKHSRISGSVFHLENDPVEGLSRPEAVAGVKVTIAGMAKTYELFTDTNG